MHWRRMAKWFSGNGFVWAANVARCSFSARTAIAANAIAALRVALAPGAGSAAVPTVGTSTARRDGSIIATGSGSTANAGREPA
jgi:hypothetical protein